MAKYIFGITSFGFQICMKPCKHTIKNQCDVLVQKLPTLLTWWLFKDCPGCMDCLYMHCLSNFRTNNTREHDFGTWKVYCVSKVTFHAEFKYAIKFFPSPTVLVQWHFLLLIFQNFRYFFSVILLYVNQYFKWFEQRVVTNNLPLSNH